MPLSYRIDRTRSVVLTEAWGVLTDEDILGHKARLLNDPDFDPSMPQVSDIRNIERLDVTATGVQAMVEHDTANADRRARHPLALVVPGEAVFGMARMYQLVGTGSGRGVEVFRTMDEANAWLGALR